MSAARWPHRCEMTWLAPHPSKPLLAVACSRFAIDGDANSEDGALLVVDTQSGRLRTVTRINRSVSGFDDMLAWNRDATRIAANIGTNVIAIVEGAKVVFRRSPDGGRDHGFSFTWIGERLYLDLARFLRHSHDKRQFVPPDGKGFAWLTWNETTHSVVGNDGTRIRSIDPFTGRVLYDVETKRQEKLASGVTRSMPARVLVCSSDGRRWAALRAERHRHRSHHRTYWSIEEDIVLFNGDDGSELTVIKPSLHGIDKLQWGPKGRLAFRSYRYVLHRGHVREHIDVVIDDKLARSIDLGSRHFPRKGAGVSGLSHLAWSANGERLATMVSGGEVQIHEASSGKLLERFKPAVPSAEDPVTGQGLAWAGNDRIVFGDAHFLAVYTVDGVLLAQWFIQ